MQQPIISIVTLRELLRLALPMVVSQGAFAVMIFTDRYFMSQIDAAHLAAALGGGVAAFFSLSLFTGTLSYANALVAQYYGAGELTKCSRVVTQGMLISLLSLPILAVVTYWGAGIFSAMGHEPQQLILEQRYYTILMAGCFFTLIKTCIASFFAGIGQTRVVMICDVLGMILNIPLTYALVFGELGLPTMGLAGAGIATVVATLFSCLLFIAFYCRPRQRLRFKLSDSLHIDRGILRRYLRLGVPSGFESFMNIATFNLFLLMFQSYGITQGAAIAIVFNWDVLSFIPLIGMNISVMTLIGRFVGAGDMTRANQVISAGFILSLTYSGLLGLCFVLFRVPLVDIFEPPLGDFSEIRQLASMMMIGLSTYVMADAISLVASGALRGAGDTRWLMITSISLHWTMLIIQYFVIMVFEVEPIISWWIFVALLITLAVTYLGRLLGGSWRQTDRLAKVMAE